MKTFSLKPLAILLIAPVSSLPSWGWRCFSALISPSRAGLPGDIAINRENLHFYFPLGTSLIISLLLTVVINLLLKLFGR
ncbi:MAG: DUF2905 domain-containing protein [Chloroflexota bacterium]